MCYLAYFQLNIDYITEAFCENKEKVELSCNGKCHLAKQLQADTSTQDEDKSLRVPSEIFSLVFIEKSSSLDLFQICIPVNKEVNKRYLKGYTYTLNYECFRPPMS